MITVAEWVTALRSGTYEQGQTCMRYVGFDGITRHCCLGVGAELAGLSPGGLATPRERFLSDLPESLWEGTNVNLTTKDGKFLASELNDGTTDDGEIEALNFLQIADVIESTVAQVLNDPA